MNKQKIIIINNWKEKNVWKPSEILINLKKNWMITSNFYLFTFFQWGKKMLK